MDKGATFFSRDQCGAQRLGQRAADDPFPAPVSRMQTSVSADRPPKQPGAQTPPPVTYVVAYFFHFSKHPLTPRIHSTQLLSHASAILPTTTMAASLATQPPPTPTYLLSYPAPHVVLITINRPRAMNSLPYASHWEADALLTWFDSEPTLRVAVVTGAGEKAFCAGQDLIEQDQIQKLTRSGQRPPRQMLTHPPSGFMGISRREGKKPVIAAVNGFAMGGGFEICLNW